MKDIMVCRGCGNPIDIIVGGSKVTCTFCGKSSAKFEELVMSESDFIDMQNYSCIDYKF